MGKKKNKVILISVIIISIILIALIAGLFLYLKPTGQVAVAPSDLQSDLGKCSGGWTNFAVSRVDINGVNKIRVYGSAKGSECMRIIFDKDDLNEELAGTGLQATKDVTIGNVKLTSYSKTFPIDKTGNYYPSIQVQTFSDGLDTCRLNVGDAYSCCKKHGIVSIAKPFYTGTLGYNTNCIYLGSNGLQGTFDASRSYGDFNVLFDFNGEQHTLSRGQQAINSNNGKIHIEWTGNLQPLDEIYPPGYEARLIFSNYDLVQSGAYSLTQQKVSDFVNCYNPTVTQSKYTSCKSTFDGSVNTILINKLDKYKTDNKALIYDAKTDSNNLFVSLKATPFPTFILDLDASYFGILALEGKPKITSCITTQNDLKSGENKVVSLSVKNDANSNNVEFYGSLTCTTGLQGFFTNTYFDANQEKTISVELNPSNPDVNKPNLPVSCSVKVNDLKSGKSDSCSFSGSVAYDSGIICTPNSLSCDEQFKNVMKCTSDGKNKVINEECNYGCELYGNGARCRSQDCAEGLIRCPDGLCKEECNDGECTGHWYYLYLDKAWCLINQWLLAFKVVFSIVIGFLAGLISGLYANKFIPKDIKSKKWIVLAVILVMAGAFGFLAYIYFWAIVITSILMLIIYGLIKWFVPGI